MGGLCIYVEMSTMVAVLFHSQGQGQLILLSWCRAFCNLQWGVSALNCFSSNCLSSTSLLHLSLFLYLPSHQWLSISHPLLVSSCLQAKAYRSWKSTMHLGLWASPCSVSLLSTSCHLFCPLDCLWGSGSFFSCCTAPSKGCFYLGGDLWFL